MGARVLRARAPVSGAKHASRRREGADGGTPARARGDGDADEVDRRVALECRPAPPIMLASSARPLGASLPAPRARARPPTGSSSSLLARVTTRRLSVAAATSSFGDDASSSTLEVGDFAKLDLGRTARTGLPEVVWGPGKTPEQILAIMEALRDKQSAVLATRVAPEVYDTIRALNPDVRYDPVARVCQIDGTPSAPPLVPIPGVLAVLTAGTADLSVAREASVTARAMGVEDVRVIADVGVAGLQRILSRLEEIREADVILVVAGMDGALPSVAAGLVDAPVIAVPTSVGYGAAMGGLSPLMATLNSCAVGVTVVNIDNGFGAAMAAIKMLRAAERVAGRSRRDA
jgi:NCAIR mutase (PurE)-related protein